MIYIILPVHNRKVTTEKFIKSLVAQTYKEFKLILVDDGSTDGTDKMVLSYIPDGIILKGDGNLWWAGGLQKGYEWLILNAKNEDLCLLINDDTVFDENFLNIATKIFSNKNDTLLLAQCYSQKDLNLLLDDGVHFDFRSLTFIGAKSKEEINCLSTRGLFLKVKDLKVIGGFFPKILPHYLSDYEFTIRAFNKGFKLMTDETLKLYVDQETTGLHTINYNGIRDYYSKYFSNRNPSNPFHWLAFVYLVVPYPFKIYHIFKIIYRLIKNLIKPILSRKSNDE